MTSAVFCGVLTNDGIPLTLKAAELDVRVRGWAAESQATLTYENSLAVDLSDVEFVFPATKNIGLCAFESTVDGNSVVAQCTKNQQQPSNDKQHSEAVSLAAQVFRIPLGAVKNKGQIVVRVTLIQELRRDPETGFLHLEFCSILIPCQMPRWEIGRDANAIRDRLRLPSNHLAVTDEEYNLKVSAQVRLGQCGRVEKLWLTNLRENVSQLEHLPGETSLKFSNERFRTSQRLNMIVQPSDVNLPAVYVEPSMKAELNSSNPWKDRAIASAWYEPGILAESSLASGDEYWLILDRSGSMSGAKNEEAKKMLLLFVKSLPVGSRFNIVGFGTSHEVLFQGCVDYTDANVEKALKYASNLRANLGGTSVLGPLNLIFGSKRQPSTRCRYVILLTDGQFAESVESVKRLVEANANFSRLFTIGIGKDVNRMALEDLARVGNGMSEFIDGVADFQIKVINMMKAMSHQSLSGFKLDWIIDGGVVDRRLPPQLANAFYFGNPMKQSVSITSTGSKHGSLGGEANFTSNGRPNVQVKFQIPENGSDESILHQHAAFQQLQELLENPSRQAEAAKLSEQTGILCEHTSFALKSPNSPQLFSAATARNRAGFDDVKAPVIKAELRSGKADESSVQLADEVVASVRSFEAIAGLQQINGSWLMNEDLVKIVASSFLPSVDLLKERVVKSCASRLSPEFAKFDDVLGTLAALALLRRRFLDRHDQWIILERKALAFLRSKQVAGVDQELLDLLAIRLENESAPTEETIQQYNGRVDIFSQVDQHALAISRDNAQHDRFQDLITLLINSTSIGSDLEKARAIFIWLSAKDLSQMNFENAMPGSPEEVLMNLKAGKESYAYVYEMLCSRAGLNCVTIIGYVKGIGYHPGQSFEGQQFQGAWNAVKIEGKYCLVNPNWAARRLSSEGLKYELDEFFFLTDPKQLIHTHYPKDEAWQLLDQPISLSQFEMLPPAKSLFFTLGLKFIGQSNQAILKADENGTVCLKLALDRPDFASHVDFDYALVLDKSNPDILRSFVYHETNVDGTVIFYIRLPHRGEFRFVIFAAKQNQPFNLIKKDAKQTYSDICEWKIVNDVETKNQPYPPCSGSKWGPPHPKVSEFRGISAIEPSKGRLLANDAGIVEIKFQKATKQEMYFLAKLRAYGQQYSQDELDRSHMNRQIGDDQVIFTVSAPGKGEFGLEIFSNRVDAEKAEDGESQESCSLFPLCQFLVVNEREVAGPLLTKLPPGYLGAQPELSAIGLYPVSHPDPFTVLSKVNLLEVVFGKAEPNRPIRATANLIRMADAKSSFEQDLTDFVLHQTPLSGDRLAFVCQFPTAGTFKLEIFALANDAMEKANSIPAVFNYLIEVSPHDFPSSSVTHFPKQFSQWHDGCFLVTPLNGVLTAGSDQEIPVKLALPSNVKRVVAIAGSNQWELEQKDGIWEAVIPKGMIQSNPDKLRIMANFSQDPPKSFAVLLEYDICY